MKHLLALCLGIFWALSFPAMAQNASPTARSLHQTLRAFFASEWERGLRESPETATYNGDTRFDDRWSDMSLAAIHAREAADRAAWNRLQAIPRAALSSADQLDYDTFTWQLQRNIERQAFKEYLQPIGHQGGIQTADGITETMAFANAADYNKWLSRMRALPVLVDQNLALLEAGLQAGLTPPRVLMERVPAQLAAQVVDDGRQSPFYRPFLKMNSTISAADQERLRTEAQAIIRTAVVPAYAKLQSYFNGTYLPRTRTGIATSSQPNGKAYYDFLARYYTTTSLSADAIHALGLKEVARLRIAMESVKDQTGYQGSMADFFNYLRSDPRFFYTSPEALLAGYRALAKRIDPELVKVFKLQPRIPYGVRAIPANIAPDTTTAYYQPGASDGSRAGNYYVNLYKPEVRPTWEMVPLTLHEAVPGHHFQFARALELADAPLFRKTAYFVAYGEGWALYAEQLGTEMGLYDDPYDRFGQLTYEMWRAVRLVVDTGIHVKGWTRDQAISFFKDNAPKTEQDIVNEIDRYIGTPGQALAYKIGQLKISELRGKAQQTLGAHFDLRDFNDEVLSTGSVPLDTLEKHLLGWMKARGK